MTQVPQTKTFYYLIFSLFIIFTGGFITMKKSILTILFVAAVSFAMASPALAGPPVFHAAGSAAISHTHNGMGILAGGAGGKAISGGLGFYTYDGYGEVSDTGGKDKTKSTTFTATYQLDSSYVPSADFATGVGSQSGATGKVSASLDLDAITGHLDGQIAGITGEATSNGSGLHLPDPFYKTDGHTGGEASQFAVGGFYGNANAQSDRFFCWTFPGYADLNASVKTKGMSESDSYRFVTYDGWKTQTEGMGTNVFATTNVKASAGTSDFGWGSNAAIVGGYIAAGAVSASTHQEGASASANGSYGGMGTLGANYNGSAAGYTATQVTTSHGQVTSVVSQAGMTTSSSTTSN
jgi:hypothetical protein